MKASDLFEDWASILPRDIRVVDWRNFPIAFSVYRDDRPSPWNSSLSASDLLVFDSSRSAIYSPDDFRQCSLFVYFNRSTETAMPVPAYQPLPIPQKNPIMGLGPTVDYGMPTPLLWLDEEHFKNWGCWGEWAFTVNLGRDETLVYNPLANRARAIEINMDDNFRAGAIYLRFYEATGSLRALSMARKSVELAINMQKEDGSFYYVYFPWAEPGQNAVSDRDWHGNDLSGHSWGVWLLGSAYKFFYQKDPVFAGKIRTGLVKAFNYAFSPEGLKAFQTTLMMSGLIEFYETNRNPAVLQYINTLAGRAEAALANSPPWSEAISPAVWALADAYRVTDNKHYLDVALRRAMSGMVPSTFRIQGPYQFYPVFQESWPGIPAPVGCQIVHVWYIMEAYLALYRATGDEKWLYLAGRQIGFEYGDNDWGQVRMKKTLGSEAYSLADKGTEGQLAGLSYYIYELKFPILARLKYVKTAFKDSSGLPEKGSIKYAGYLFSLGNSDLKFVPLDRQLPGDCNQDGRVDLSDAICLLGHLFLGDPPNLPCDGGTDPNSGNHALLNFNGEGDVDVSDAISLLRWIFMGGPPHALGISCLPIAGCPDSEHCR
ncbi:MAG: hypothetical protein HY717_19585 [Planctomycetes bacterium]|nr:hypothetical protein [Planctomycetota bacterium]